MTLVHIRYIPCSGIYFCGAGEYCQGFPSLFGLGKLGQAFSSQMSCEHCFSTSISERSNKRRTGRRAERLGHLVRQFISHPAAEDHRKPGRVLGFPACREVISLAKVFMQKVVDLHGSESAPVALWVCSGCWRLPVGRGAGRLRSCCLAFVSTLVNMGVFEDILTKQQELPPFPMSRCNEAIGGPS